MVLLFSAQASAQTPLRITDADLDWRVVNDTVMGGRSSSQLERGGTGLLFSGYLNTNGGGFVSIRSARQDWNLAGFDRVRIKVRGDGRAYQLRLQPGGSRYTYRFEFATVADEWIEVEGLLENFEASWRGRKLNRPPPDPADIVGVGVLLGDGRDGDFQLEIAWMEFAAAPVLGASL
ncbi:MAG: CIA30 family protein [Pseudomonadota bacterium]